MLDPSTTRPAAQRLAPAFARCGRRALHGAGRAREARRGRRLDEAVALEVDVARPHVRVRRCLVEREHRRDAGVGAFEQRGPRVARLGRKTAASASACAAPAGRPSCSGAGGRPGEVPSRSSRTAKNLRLERADRDVAAVGARVAAVVRRRAAEQVALARERQAAVAACR